jgi:hypothetical protein
MGYLDNTSVIVDAILTKKGRELLSRQDGSFRITQFALADDEIDYSLYNENHPDGSNYYGEAIENLPLIEAIPNESNIMISKLTTLPRGTTTIPVLQVPSTAISVGRGSNFNISPVTLNLAGTNNSQESGYSFTIADRRLLSAASTSGRVTNTISIPYTGTALSQTLVGTSFTGTSITGITLFGNNSTLTTSIIVVGLDTGARTTITLTINKNNTASAISAQR